MPSEIMKNNIFEVIRNYPDFSKTFLKIRTKSGKVKPFDLNKAQHYLHDRLQNQLKKTGRVRAIILKGRQQGCSTYIQGRFFHKVVTTQGKKAFILTHEAEATKNLFDMAKRFYDLLPDGLVPKYDKSSAKELNFNTLNSGYSVGTAGNRSTGRSQTVQLMHASEVAYYQHAEDHAKGILQAVSNEDETEIIMESTANGIGNYFYNIWCSAVSGDSDFQAIFIPWYWQDEYKDTLREGETVCTDEEQELLERHAQDGLTIEHLYWRRRKLKDFSNDHETAVELFNVEYPFTALDAFRNPVADRFINTKPVLKARKNVVESQSPLVIGVDVARYGSDSTAIVRRRGRLVYDIEKHNNLNTMQTAGLIRRIIDSENPSRVFVDTIGVGAGVYDRLCEAGYMNVEAVDASRRADDFERFRNTRAELWYEMREWLSQEAGVQLPDSDELQGDLTSLGYHYDSSGKLVIESKEDLIKRGMKSPDVADALALTFFMGEYVQTSDSYMPRKVPSNAAGKLI